MKTRLLFVRQGCPHCRQMLRVINKINMKLPLDKRIEVIDCYEYEEFDLQNIPLISKLEKDGLKEGYPFLFVDGVRVEPAPTENQLKLLLENFLSEDLY